MAGTKAALACAALVSAAGLACREAPAPPEEQVYGVQMHLHGSLSEGLGSMRGHNVAAAALGGAVDVLWWTDHDWRLHAYTYVDGFDFEDGFMSKTSVPAPVEAEEWENAAGVPIDPAAVETVTSGWQRQTVARPLRDLRLRFGSEEARSGRSSLRIDAQAGRSRPGPQAAEPERLVLAFTASNRRHTASLASDLRVGLSLLPVRLEGDARIVVSVLLSQHPPDFHARLDYRLTPQGPGSPGEARVEHVRQVDARLAYPLEVVTVDLPWQPGAWNDLVLELSRDADRYGLGGADNSLAELSISLEARDGGRISTYVDNLRIERRRLGEALFEEEKRIAQGLGRDGLVNHVGQEISYAAHLNAYGADVPLADPLAHPRGMTPAEAVEFTHAHGGIVSLNHFFGVSEDTLPFNKDHYEGRVASLVSVRAWGADLLEVGYRRRGFGLHVFLDLWDRLSAEGIFITGTGVSDSHNNDAGWTTGPNNFITWVLAPSSSQEDLIEALRAGRAFFGDPTRFDGRLDITTAAGARMGQVVAIAESGNAEQEVRYRAQGLRAGQTLRVVRNGVPGPPLAPREGRLEWSEPVAASGPTWLRIEVRDGAEGVAFSNPLYLWPASSQPSLPAARRP